MSCGNPTVESDALMPRRKKYDKTRQCVRCKLSTGNVVIRYAVYCKECFFPLITHKFRRSLEPSVNERPQGPRRTALKPAGNLLVGFSGGLGSTVLLDLVHRCYVSMDQSTMPSDGGKQHPRHEKIWKRVSVCYVEIAGAFPGMQDSSPDVETLIAQHDGVDLISLRIQDAFDPAWWQRVAGRPALSDLDFDLTTEELHLIFNPSSSSTPLEKLQAYLASLPTATAVHSTIQNLIRLLLLHTALQTQSSHLVLGTSLTSLAMSLISGVSQGRGFNLKEEMQEEWVPSVPDPAEDVSSITTRRRYVRVIRPLRDVGRKECTLWTWWTGLRVVAAVRPPWVGARQDIGTLTHDFITGLERDYPSTVSTIVRTCAKVAPKGEVSGLCLLCARPVQHGIQEWKSRISIRTRDVPDAGEQSSAQVPAPLAPHLCYACHTTLTSKSSRPPPALYPEISRSSVAPAPVWVLSFMTDREMFQTSRMNEQDQRNTLKDFLLED